MRISDWSSDVCSSDLIRSQLHLFAKGLEAGTPHAANTKFHAFTPTSRAMHRAIFCLCLLYAAFRTGIEKAHPSIDRVGFSLKYGNEWQDASTSRQDIHQKLYRAFTPQVRGDRKSTRLNSSH